MPSIKSSYSQEKLPFLNPYSPDAYSPSTGYNSDDVIGVKFNGCVIHPSLPNVNESQDLFSVGKIFFKKDTAKLEVKKWKKNHRTN